MSELRASFLAFLLSLPWWVPVFALALWAFLLGVVAAMGIMSDTPQGGGGHTGGRGPL